ncbi:MAG: hypothetical protein ACI4GZ_00095 [Ruminococcus sp.]
MKLSIRKCKGINESIEDRLKRAGNIATPLCTVSSLLIILSYAFELIFGGSLRVLGEVSGFSKIFYSLGTFLQSTALSLASAVISYLIGGVYATPAGLAGGIMAERGVDFFSPAGNTGNISGLFGSMVSGLFAGGFFLLLQYLFSYKSKKEDTKNTAIFFASVLSLIVNIGFTSFVNSLSGILNFTATALLAFGTKYSLLTAAAIGTMMTADLYGPLYLSAYLFGVASLSIGNTDAMASVTAAAMVAPVSMGVSAVIFRKRFSPFEKLSGISGIISGIGGVSVSALPQYLSHPFRSAVAFIPGGIVSSVLSQVFGCGFEVSAGGVFALAFIHNPLLLLIAALCGVLISTAIMGLLTGTGKEENNEKAKGEPAKNLSPG